MNPGNGVKGNGLEYSWGKKNWWRSGTEMKEQNCTKNNIVESDEFQVNLTFWYSWKTMFVFLS